MDKFDALLIEQKDKQVSSSWVKLDVTQLDVGNVFIRVAYSSINYKDALAATGAGKIIRRFPCVGGIDLAGYVVDGGDSGFKPGDAVVATSYDIGVAHHGGYADYARVPAQWVLPLPTGLSLQDAMALGTAGFTAALGVTRMEQNGLSPEKGPVIVTGATGGVGSLAIDMLATKGYAVTALTGKVAEAAYLKDLGASEVLMRQDLDFSKIRPLDAARWAGAVDNLGGDVLAWICSTMKPWGTIASIGLAASHTLNTTVMPFILRGVSLLGIDSGYVDQPLRGEVWQRLATDLKPRHLDAVTTVIGKESLPENFQNFLEGRIKGRVVVKISGDA